MKVSFLILTMVLCFGIKASRPLMDSLSNDVNFYRLKPRSAHIDSLHFNAYWYYTYHSIYFHERKAKQRLDSLALLSKNINWKVSEGLLLVCKAYYASYFENDYAKGLDLSLKGHDVLKTKSNYKALAAAKVNITSIMLWNIRNLPTSNNEFWVKGMKYADEILAIGNAEIDNEIKCLGYIYRANYLNTIGRYKKALDELLMAEKLLQQTNMRYLTENFIYGMLLTTFNVNKDFRKANIYADKVISLAEGQNDYYSLLSICRFKGEQELAIKSYKKAEDYFLKSYAFAKEFGVTKFISLAEGHLYNFYKLIKDPEKALLYYELYQKNDEALANEKTQKIYADYDLTSKEKKIILLENEKLVTANKRQKLMRSILIFGMLALSSFLIYFFITNRKLLNKNVEIEAALLRGQTLERKRVAQDLHDNLSAKISGVKWRLEAIKPDFEMEKHKQIYDSTLIALSEIYTDVRLIAHNLLPIELETKGLESAMNSFVIELNSLGKTDFKLKFGKNFRRLSTKIEYELFSIVLELTNNILKHSEASQASIYIHEELQEIGLIVADNGKGISEDQINKGMGMSNIQSRIATVNGKLTVKNENGLKVMITIPC